MKLLPLAFVLVALAAGCGGQTTGPSAPLDARVTIGYGQTLSTDGGVSLRFDTVLEDSRCPMNAMCVWAGQAIVQVTVIESDRERRAEIRSDPPASRTARVGDLRLEWQQLEPYPVAGRPMTPSEYRLTVRVTR
jgi:hypothetical protein